MNRYLILVFLCLSQCLLHAQKIHIILPAEANQRYLFMLKRGIKNDTVQQGRLSVIGDVIINIPQQHKGYVGIATLELGNSNHMNVVVNNEDFAVEQQDDKKYKFTNSPENQYLYSIIQDRVQPAADSTLYAFHFMEIIRYLQSLDKIVKRGGTQLEKDNARLYQLNDLNMDCLLTSGFWFHVIDNLTKLSTDQQTFAQDMVRVLKRVKSPQTFEILSGNLISITDQYGWDDAFDILVPYIQESGRIPTPTGSIYKAFALAKVKKGTIAPPIQGLEQPLGKTNHEKTLLVFFQSDCDNCKKQIEELIKEYPKLKQANVRVISMSADYDKDQYNEETKRFGWSDKLCDLKGFAGENFTNYGILGTPTFFLLDEDQKIIKRYAFISEVIKGLAIQ